MVVHELEREKPEEKCCDEDRCRGTEHHDATAPIGVTVIRPFMISRQTRAGLQPAPCSRTARSVLSLTGQESDRQ